MILWDRVKKSLDGGVEKVTRVSKVLSERARIEAAVARLLIDKGNLETREEKAVGRLGGRVYLLWEQKTRGIMRDPEVLDALREISGLREEISQINLAVHKVSSGDEET